MNHERFVQLARERAFNERGGLRRLAPHVRRLYGAIRALQEDDNAFCYIAEVIQEARGDKTDAEAFMHRVKSYYHRDRKALGDPVVVRGSRRILELERTHTAATPGTDRTLAYSSPETTNEAISGFEHRPGGWEPPAVTAKPHHGSALSGTPSRQAPSVDDLRDMTSALSRRGHRRLAPGG